MIWDFTYLPIKVKTLSELVSNFFLNNIFIYLRTVTYPGFLVEEIFNIFLLYGLTEILKKFMDTPLLE